MGRRMTVLAKASIPPHLSVSRRRSRWSNGSKDAISWAAGKSSFSRILSLADVVMRFLSPAMAEKYDLDLPSYEGLDQVVEISAKGQKL